MRCQPSGGRAKCGSRTGRGSLPGPGRRPATILEQAGQVGAAWHRHYSRLHLHTDKARSQLPFAAFAPERPRYPSRQQVIDYLEAYAGSFGLDIRLGQPVVDARPIDGAWEVRTQDRTYRCRNLVVATGQNQEPDLPTWPGQSSFRGPVLHSSDYRDGERFRGRRVLVVGFGNSGGEIAIDLCEHGAEPSIAVRGPVNVVPARCSPSRSRPSPCCRAGLPGVAGGHAAGDRP